MTKKIFYPVLVLALTLFGLQSCEPKTSVKKPVVEATVPTVKAFDIPLDISTMIEMPKSSASTLRDAQEHVLYEGSLSWDMSEIVNSSGLSQAEIKSIKLDKVTMECVKPEGVDLTLFAPIYLYAGQDYKLFAETSADSSRPNLLDLILHEKDLVQYIKADQLPMRITTTRDKISDWPYGDAPLHITLTFYTTSKVRAK